MIAIPRIFGHVWLIDDRLGSSSEALEHVAASMRAVSAVEAVVAAAPGRRPSKVQEGLVAVYRYLVFAQRPSFA